MNLVLKRAVLALVCPLLLASATLARGAEVKDQRLHIDLEGRGFELSARVFRPDGSGPFPLAVIHHGTAVSLDDARSTKLGFTRPPNGSSRMASWWWSL